MSDFVATRLSFPSYGDLSIEEWDNKWEPVPDGFRQVQTELGRHIGIFAAKCGDKFMYIGAATQIENGGLRAGLARGRVREQTNNSSAGFARLRENVDAVEAYVICTENPISRVVDAKELKKAMIKRHAPPWNVPDKIVVAARRDRYEKG